MIDKRHAGCSKKVTVSSINSLGTLDPHDFRQPIFTCNLRLYRGHSQTCTVRETERQCCIQCSVDLQLAVDEGKTSCLQVSDGHAAQLVCCSQPSTAALSFDQLCNSATQLSCTSRLALEAASRQQLRQFQEPSGYGLILLLFSLLLTHGVRCCPVSSLMYHAAVRAPMLIHVQGHTP